tara:strand:- start:2992 stop:3495 length:504 start_codon:yes stop_codon:yes gene_type:complete
MALGKNIRVDKLIPELKEKSTIDEKLNTSLKHSVVSKKSIVKKDEIKEEVKAIELEDNFEEGIKFIIEPSRRKSVSKVKVFIEGKLGVYNAEYLTNKIKEVIVSYNVIDIKLRNIEDLDLSSIQILYYFANHYKDGKKIVLFHMEDLSINLKTLLVKTKYNNIIFKK